MAYYTVYGEYPKQRLRGRTAGDKKIWHGLDVDASLKDEWLEALNELPVEIRSTDEGKDETRIAFVIFRMPEGKDDLADTMVNNLQHHDGIKAHSDIGSLGRPRICVASRLWLGEPGWSEWWQSLPEKIRTAYDQTVEQRS